MGDELLELKTELKAVLVSQKLALTMPQLMRDYEALTSKKIPCREFGFSNAPELLDSLTDTLRIFWNGSAIVVEAVHDSKLDNIKGLVNGQKPSKTELNRMKMQKTTVDPALSCSPAAVPGKTVINQNANLSQPILPNCASSFYQEVPTPEDDSLSTFSLSQQSSRDVSENGHRYNRRGSGIHSRHASKSNIVSSFCIANLRFNVSQKALASLFEEFGQVKDVAICRREPKKSNRTIAFIQIELKDDAERAASFLNGTLFDGLKITVSPKIHDGHQKESVQMSSSESSVYVGNIDGNVNVSSLMQLFSRHGNVLKIDVFKKNPNAAYAFVMMSDLYDAMSAIRELDGTYFNGLYIFVNTSLRQK